MPFVFRSLLALLIAMLVASVSLGQTDVLPGAETAASWKSATLADLDRQLAAEDAKGDSRRELDARKAWLKNWSPGSLTSEPTKNLQLLTLRIEPILDSELSKGLRQRLMDEDTAQDEADFLILKEALADHSSDIGLQQLHFHWIDHPSRRKTNLKQIDDAARRLIQSLESQKVTMATDQLALEFALYRRGRALAYRELPDVLDHTPIEDPEELDREIQSAYRNLIEVAGNGRPEFILLEIRMHRRDKSFGTALGLVEQYGPVIKPQWYLKKRRDLLKELEWEIPFAEAAKIYAEQFPDEVAKEQGQR